LSSKVQGSEVSSSLRCVSWLIPAHNVEIEIKHLAEAAINVAFVSATTRSFSASAVLSGTALAMSIAQNL
jgi:hypothetical protein